MVAAISTVFLWLLVSAAVTIPAMILDGGLTEIAPGDPVKIGPWFFLGNNVALGLSIPLVMLMQWGIMGQRPGWISSIAGRLRWRWLSTCLGAAAAVLLAIAGVEMALSPPGDLQVREYTTLLIVGILVTTPFQAAGEEYLLRGMLTRLVGSYFRNPTLGWVIAAAVSSVTFTWMHAAADWWLNSFYLTFGLAASWVTWRTGGLEAAIAIHVVNNLVAELTLPWSDISGIMDRSAGAGDATILIHVGAIASLAALLTLLGRRRGLTAAPIPRGA